MIADLTTQCILFFFFSFFDLSDIEYIDIIYVILYYTIRYIRLILTQLIRTKQKCIRIIQTINDGVLTIPKGSAINLRQRGYSWSVCMYSVKDALCICTV